MRQIRRGVVLAALLSLLLVIGAGLAACGGPTYSPRTDYAIGAGVSITGHQVPRGIKATIASPLPAPTPDFVQIDDAVEITPAGTLPSSVMLQFKLDQRMAAGDTVALETGEGANGPWTLMSATVSPDGWYATVETSHLSWWQPFRFDLSSISNQVKQLVNSVVGDVFTTAQPPTCANSAAAQRAGYRVNGYGDPAASALYWCFGIESGKPVLKIVNRMRYPLDVAHPGLKEIATPGWTQSLDQLARIAAGQQTLLFPFEEADYQIEVSAGQSATVVTSHDPNTEMLSILETGLTIAANVLGEDVLGDFFRGERVSSPVVTSKAASVAIWTTMNQLLASESCLKAAQVAANDSTLSLGDVTSAFQQCFNPILIAKFVPNAIKAGILNLVLAAAGVIGLIIDPFNTLFDGTTGRDVYHIDVNTPSATSTPPSSSTPIASPSPPTAPPSSSSRVTLGAPTAALNGSGFLEVFAVGSDGNVWHSYFHADSGTWDAWRPLSAQMTHFVGKVGVLLNSGNPRGLELYAHDSTHRVWHNYYHVDRGFWDGWSPLPGITLAGDITAISNAFGGTNLYALSTDGTIWEDYYNGANGSFWNNWWSLGSLPAGRRFSGDVGALLNFGNPRGFELYARDTSGETWHNYYHADKGFWDGWSLLPGATLSGDVCVVSDSSGGSEIFAPGTDGTIWHDYYNGGNGSFWNNWTSMGQPA